MSGLGTLYGIGVGPGDPEWITVKGARTLAACRQVFVPRSGAGAESVALEIARPYLKPDAVVHELLFPMTTDRRELHQSWQAAARQVLQPLEAGEDCCFLTLGDAMFYSTYVFLLDELRRLRRMMKEARCEHGIRAPSRTVHAHRSPQLGGIQVRFEQRHVRESSRLDALPRAGELGRGPIDANHSSIEWRKHVQERTVTGPCIDGQTAVL